MLEISEVREDELPELAALYQQLSPTEASVPNMRLVLSRNEDDPSHVVWAARRGGRLVGSLLAVTCEMLFGQCRSFMVVEDVVVDVSHRRTGVGAALLRTAEDYAKTRNCSYIMLVTDTYREGAQRFYELAGYQSDGFTAFKKTLSDGATE
jgi:GNAT superfamily N-acetyltransferase